MNRPLLDSALIESMLTREAPWCDSHGAQDTYVGAGLLYYTLAYTMRAEVAVCLGSGGGFVPRLMRQAQRDAGIADTARTILVDGDVPDAGWGSPHWLEPESFFRVNYPDVELVLSRTSEAAELLAGQDVRIDYLHIDADHSFEGCLEDFTTYRPLLHVGSLVTLHDTNFPQAGVKDVLEHLRARADCELVDLVEAGMGTALLRIVSDGPLGLVPPLSPDALATVEIERRPDPPRLAPPTMQWRYLRSEAFSMRNVLAAHFVRDCPTVIEIGGWHTPIDRYLTGRHASVVVIDPFIREAARDELNGHPCHVRHVRSRFQDLTWSVREPDYGLVILGLDLEGLSGDDEQTLFELVRHARTTVIEFPTSWGRSREQYERLLAGSGADVLACTRLDLGGNDFGDLTNSWPPRVERELYILGRRERTRPPAPVATDAGDHWRPQLPGDVSAWTTYGGHWSLDDGSVRLVGDGGEWASLELDAPLRSHRCFVVEVTVAGHANAAGISFGPYMDLLTHVEGPPRRVRVEADADWGTWSLHVDGSLAPRTWWDELIASAADLRDGRLSLKARHAGDVRFTDLALRTLERPCRVSVVLTCNRFLQRLRLGLRTWCAQDLPEGSLEVLVVNPQSPDGTAEHIAAVARAWQNVRVREIPVSPDIATNKGTMINRALDVAAGSWVWIADADCLFPPSGAREALRAAEAAPRHVYFLRRRHLSPELTDALIAGRLDPVHDFDRLTAATPVAPAEDRAPWGYTQLLPRAAFAEIRYREDVNHFAHTDEIFVEACRRRGYRPRELTGLLCLHLDHPFSWEGTTGFL
jgi:hypothetical protein